MLVLPFPSRCCAADTSWFLSDRAPSLLTHQKLSSPPTGFFLHVRYSIGWFFFSTQCNSLQPQWGHFNIIHCFRNTLQTNWASGDETHGHLWHCYSSRDLCHFTSFWVIYMKPASTKMTFTVPMICTLLPLKWLYLDSYLYFFWLVKTKLASFFI